MRLRRSSNGIVDESECEDCALNARLTIDRFEGSKRLIAVLVTDDGDQINVPKKLLPRGAKAGDILSVTIEKDAEATRRVASATRAVQEDLSKSGPGGDIQL